MGPALDPESQTAPASDDTAPQSASPPVAKTGESAAPAPQTVPAAKAEARAAGNLGAQAPDRANADKPATFGIDAVAPRTTAFAPAARESKFHTAAVGQPAAMPTASSPAGSIGGALFALVLVVGLILALAWLARRMPGLSGALGGTRGNAALRVVGSLALGPRERVVVVAVGETQLLLGVGAGGTRTLHTLETPLPEQADGRKTAPAFAQLLAQQFGKKA